MTVAELHAGLREAERDATVTLIDSRVVLPVTREIAEIAGRVLRAARASRTHLADCLIAATGILEAMPVALARS